MPDEQLAALGRLRTLVSDLNFFLSLAGSGSENPAFNSIVPVPSHQWHPSPRASRRGPTTRSQAWKTKQCQRARPEPPMPQPEPPTIRRTRSKPPVSQLDSVLQPPHLSETRTVRDHVTHQESVSELSTRNQTPDFSAEDAASCVELDPEDCEDLNAASGCENCSDLEASDDEGAQAPTDQLPAPVLPRQPPTPTQPPYYPAPWFHHPAHSVRQSSPARRPWPAHSRHTSSPNHSDGCSPARRPWPAHSRRTLSPNRSADCSSVHHSLCQPDQSPAEPLNWSPAHCPDQPVAYSPTHPLAWSPAENSFVNQSCSQSPFSDRHVGHDVDRHEIGEASESYNENDTYNDDGGGYVYDDGGGGSYEDYGGDDYDDGYEDYEDY